MSARSECPTRAQLVAYLEGALPAKARQAFEAHVTSCSRCHGEIEALRPVHELLTGVSCLSEEALLMLSRQDEPPRREAAAHLSRCPCCREALAALAEARRAVVAATPAPAGAEAMLTRLRPSLAVPLSRVPTQEGAPPLLMQQQLDEIAVALQFSGQYSGLTVAMALRTAAAGPLQGVLVRACREDGKERAEAVTDAEGVARLTLRALTPARYVVEVESGDTRAFLVDVTT
jgi:anti-sigma factor RsiW